MIKRQAEDPGEDIPFETILDYAKRLSYWRRRIFLWKRTSPRPSRFLYKFRSLDPSNPTSVDRIRDVIVRSRLWLSSPVDFNDPFDMSAKFIVDATAQEKRKRIREILRRQGQKWKQIEKELPRLVSKTDAEMSLIAQTTWQNEVEATGIYSFGGDPRSILMWSHYSSNHEGLCLQFERSADPDAFFHAIPVEYNDNFPVVNWVTEFSKGLIPAMLRKHVGWRYERENRLVHIRQARKYIPFKPNALKGVIIGCEAKEGTIEALMGLLKERLSYGYKEPRIYRALKHETRYKLQIWQNPR